MTVPSSAEAAHEQHTPDLSIPRYFRKLKDPRRRHRRIHRLQDILVIARCAIIAGAQDWQEIETFGRKRKDWLRRFLPLPHGIPSHDTFERVFERLRPQAFQACFREWVQAVGAAPRIRHVAIDGKTLRGSGSAKLGPPHLVSAWATAQRLSLGQVAVDAKSNDITALPARPPAFACGSPQRLTPGVPARRISARPAPPHALTKNPSAPPRAAQPHSLVRGFCGKCSA